ncbi:NfeD family protein [bacterium]|nr:NfeD family protein [bacterium]
MKEVYVTEVWLIFFIILVIIELITVNLVTIWFALGALITSLVSLYTTDTVILLAFFVITSLLLLILTKPVVKKLKVKKVVATNLDQVIGKTGVVTEPIAKDKIGEVKVLGKTWSAYSDKEISKDKKVKILSISGVKLKVEEKEE